MYLFSIKARICWYVVYNNAPDRFEYLCHEHRYKKTFGYWAHFPIPRVLCFLSSGKVRNGTVDSGEKETIISFLYNENKKKENPFCQVLFLMLSCNMFLEDVFVVKFISSYLWLFSSSPNQEFSCQSHTGIVIMIRLSVFTQIKV